MKILSFKNGYRKYAVMVQEFDIQSVGQVEACGLVCVHVKCRRQSIQRGEAQKYVVSAFNTGLLQS